MRLTVAAALLVACTLPARAAPPSLRLTGTSLSVTSPCAKQVEVGVDAGLHDAVEIALAADHPEELAQLAGASGAAARLGRTDASTRCWRPEGSPAFKPTLTIKVRVPPHFPIAVEESGEGDYRLGAVGRLALAASGAVALQAGSVDGLAADISGSGSVRIGHAAGDAAIEISGSGSLAIDAVTLHAARIDISGDGSVKMGQGNVGRLDLDSSGSGQVAIAGTVGDASIAVSGVGAVALGQVTGTLHKEISGTGAISIEH